MGERPDPQQVLADAQLATHITVMGDGERSIVVRGNEVAATLALDALAAAGLSVVGEGEVVLGGRRHRLTTVVGSGDPVLGWDDGAEWWETSEGDRLWCAVPIEGDEPVADERRLVEP